MSDKLFFDEVGKQAKEAEAARMKARGPHGTKDQGEKTIEVAGHPGHGYGLGDNNDSGGK